MKMTPGDLARLVDLEREREPLNDLFQAEAERLFDLWNKAEPPNHGWRQFQSAHVTDTAHIRILFGTGCSCSGRGDDDYTEIPLQALMGDTEWELELATRPNKR